MPASWPLRSTVSGRISRREQHSVRTGEPLPVQLAPRGLGGVDVVDEVEDGLRQFLGSLHRSVVADAVELDGTDPR